MKIITKYEIQKSKKERKSQEKSRFVMLNSDLLILKITTQQLSSEQVKMLYGTMQVAFKLKIKMAFFIKLLISLHVLLNLFSSSS